MEQERESLEFDILFVGAGPANLASAIHLSRLLKKHNESSPNRLNPSIAIIDKGRHAGAHLLSGALLDTQALPEFLPEWEKEGFPAGIPVQKEQLWYLTKTRHLAFPSVPEAFGSSGSTICSLSVIGEWMAKKAEEEGIEFFPETAATGIVAENGRLEGILTDEKGVDRNGQPKPDYQPGMLLKTRIAIIGEGAGGSLGPQLQKEFGLLPEGMRRRYETGVKEVWRIPEGRVPAGQTHHAFGYPLSSTRYGGGWLYALSDTEISLGFVTTVEPEAPVTDPHLNLQLFKQHPFIATILKGGSMVEAGAKTITSNGFEAMGRISGPGFLLTGESAGMLDMQRLKGIHLAMKSGILAAETILEALIHDNCSAARLDSYEERFRNSWAHEELHASRNYRKAFAKGLYHGLLQTGLTLALPGISTLATSGSSVQLPPKRARNDLKALLKAKEKHRPDGETTFSKSDSLYRSGTMHEENQPCHLRISAEDIALICLERCRTEYGNPCQHFCPAGVYELTLEPVPALKINASNCLHCKTCESADPYGVITWTPPEGGGGPGYKLS
ncbi:4Fe-4S dicluster domain-containing protein [Chlorobium phaeovibrioides]|uniref:Electron transfer flavoprotein-ubiquinone oxidoreductase n=1 Tax=Chlorobium phaeovibrioides TaxID=1094 RepID=A0ABW9UNK6_CHLPH|nr:electron transfer flavoprotein-ubiquinone oxidoreductase [Chlorobium phaeovibrioides]